MTVIDARGRMIECTGVSARWCPLCGDCNCPELNDGGGWASLDSPDCPLHAPESRHAEDADDGPMRTVWGVVDEGAAAGTGRAAVVRDQAKGGRA